MRGFSLVELSIVLVILGLLTGGILAGQSLIRASELRALTTEYQRYTAAVGTFRDKYFGLPGDTLNATKFWSAQNADSAICFDTASTTQLTCNGDGDGQIGVSSGASAQASEAFRAWQHLANAGLIEGTYNGISGSVPTNYQHAVIGTNIPRSKLSNGGWSLSYLNTCTAACTTWYFSGFGGNIMMLGAERSGNFTRNPLLKPEEAWNIDTKMDDGRPGLGSIMSLVQGNVATPNCASSADPATANYNLTNSGTLCSINIKLPF